MLTLKQQKELATYVADMVDRIDCADPIAGELLRSAVKIAEKQERQHRAGGYGGRYVLSVRNTALLFVGRAFWHEGISHPGDVRASIATLAWLREDARNAVLASHHQCNDLRRSEYSRVCTLMKSRPYTHFKSLIDWDYARDVAGVA
jgi:hypothetical protein